MPARLNLFTNRERANSFGGAAHNYDTHRKYPHDLHYSTQQWVDIAFTFSNHLVLAVNKATELRAKMVELIGASGVWVGGDALAILATPDRSA